AEESGRQLRQDLEEQVGLARRRLQEVGQTLHDVAERVGVFHERLTGPAAGGRAAEPLAPQPAVPATEGRNRLGGAGGPGVGGVGGGEVLAGTPGAAAGLACGDVIGSVNDKPVLSGAELRDAVQEAGAGSLTLQVRRAGVLLPVTARLEPSPPQGPAVEAAAPE